MSRLRMKQTHDGSPDGIQVNMYSKGEVYEFPTPGLSLSLAGVFLEQGWAEILNESGPAEVPQVEPSEHKVIAPRERKGKDKTEKAVK